MSKYMMPPEWHPQDWLWIGFPHLADEWSGVIDRAQEQIAAFASAAIGLMADAVLAGGGGFHCSSQQMPSA